MSFHIPPNLIIYLAAVTFGAIVFLVRWSYWRRTDSRAKRWPMANANIQSSYEINDGGRGWITCLEYTYEANAEFYSGTYWLPGRCTQDYLAAEKAKKWLHQKIVVRYNPAKPEESAFLVEDGAPGRPYIPRTTRTQTGPIQLKL